MSNPAVDTDPRFSGGLVIEVMAVLAQHGYCEPADPGARLVAMGAVAGEVLHLARVFEGRVQADLGGPPPQPGLRVPGS
ncbi:MAG: hypothetical protein ACR2FQ_04125 [Pseudonocardiaceae bacterium]